MNRILKTLSEFDRMVVLTGISDYMRYSNRCPTYWRKKPEEQLWKLGFNHAKEVCFK